VLLEQVVSTAAGGGIERSARLALSQFQQSATSEGGFDAAEKGWLFDRRRLDRRGLDLLAVVDYWLSSAFLLALDLGSTGPRKTVFDVRAASDVGCSHYPGWRGYEAFRRRLCATGVRSSGTVRTCRGPSDADRGG